MKKKPAKKAKKRKPKTAKMEITGFQYPKSGGVVVHKTTTWYPYL